MKRGEAKNWAMSFLRFLDKVFLISEKGKCKNLSQFFYKIPKYTFFDIQNGEKQKAALDFLRFVSILFLIFEKGDKQKIGQCFFKICKYTFFNI